MRMAYALICWEQHWALNREADVICREVGFKGEECVFWRLLLVLACCAWCIVPKKRTMHPHAPSPAQGHDNEGQIQQNGQEL